MNTSNNLDFEAYEPPTAKKLSFKDVAWQDAYSILSELQPGTIIAFADIDDKQTIARFKEVERQSNGAIIIHYLDPAEHQVALYWLTKLSISETEVTESDNHEIEQAIHSTSTKVSLLFLDGTTLDVDFVTYNNGHFGYRANRVNTEPRPFYTERRLKLKGITVVPRSNS